MLRLEQVDRIDSTSDALRRRLAAGETGEAALLAREQSGGRGRLGRRWESPPGNLYMSVLLRPASLAAPGHWSILAGVALAETVSAMMPVGVRPRLKWPNDLMLGDAKLAGILAEAGTDPVPWVILGIGANVASAPAGLGRRTACLSAFVPAAAADVVAAALLGALERWRGRYRADGFGPVRQAWLGFGPGAGEPVRSSQGEGRFAGLAESGALLLETAAGPRMLVGGEIL